MRADKGVVLSSQFSVLSSGSEETASGVEPPNKNNTPPTTPQATPMSQPTREAVMAMAPGRPVRPWTRVSKVFYRTPRPETEIGSPATVSTIGIAAITSISGAVPPTAKMAQ